MSKAPLGTTTTAQQTPPTTVTPPTAPSGVMTSSTKGKGASAPASIPGVSAKPMGVGASAPAAIPAAIPTSSLSPKAPVPTTGVSMPAKTPSGVATAPARGGASPSGKGLFGGNHNNTAKKPLLRPPVPEGQGTSASAARRRRKREQAAAAAAGLNASTTSNTITTTPTTTTTPSTNTASSAPSKSAMTSTPVPSSGTQGGNGKGKGGSGVGSGVNVGKATNGGEAKVSGNGGKPGIEVRGGGKEVVIHDSTPDAIRAAVVAALEQFSEVQVVGMGRSVGSTAKLVYNLSTEQQVVMRKMLTGSFNKEVDDPARMECHLVRGPKWKKKAAA